MEKTWAAGIEPGETLSGGEDGSVRGLRRVAQGHALAQVVHVQRAYEFGCLGVAAGKVRCERVGLHT